jgi:metal-responsive CopG/Arc/MetJ family transcriptional regulator
MAGGGNNDSTLPPIPIHKKMGQMRVVTVDMPEHIIQKLEKLVKAGIFQSRAEAVRTIVDLALPEYMKLVEHEEEKPRTILNDKQWKHSTIISIKLPPAILEMLWEETRRTGMDRSKLIRLAIIKMLAERWKA